MLLSLILTQSGREALTGVAGQLFIRACNTTAVAQTPVTIAEGTVSFPTRNFRDGRRIHEVVTRSLQLAFRPDGRAEYVHVARRERSVEGGETLGFSGPVERFRSARINEVIEQLGAEHLTDIVELREWLTLRERAAVVEYTVNGFLESDHVLQAAARLHAGEMLMQGALLGGVCERIAVARTLHALANDEAHTSCVAVANHA